MSEIKWIKIVTDIFDDEKILLIETSPEADSIIVIWFKLLCLAGKQNNSGVFVMGNGIPYTDKMLATIFRRNEEIVKLALETFEHFGMVQIVENVITIPNWGKHQTLDKVESKNEYMRNYMREYRAKQEALACCKTNSKTNCKTNSKANVSSLDKEIDIEGDIDNGESVRGGKKSKRKKSPKPIRHQYGLYHNVLLSDKDMATLKQEFPSDWNERIERLSEYIACKNPNYKNHLAVIRSWHRNEMEREKSKAAADSGKWYTGNEPSAEEILGIKETE